MSRRFEIRHQVVDQQDGSQQEAQIAEGCCWADGSVSVHWLVAATSRWVSSDSLRRALERYPEATVEWIDQEEQ